MKKKGNDIVLHVAELRASDEFRFPGEAPHSLQEIGVNLPPKK
jgi:hypothetical protein